MVGNLGEERELVSASNGHAHPAALIGIGPGDFAHTLRTRLEREGCAVHEATSAAEVLELAREPLDLILLELQAPELDGLSLLKQLRSGDFDVRCPIVLVKGEGESAHLIQRGFDLGAAGYIVKHRLPSNISLAAMLSAFGASRSVAPARADACPYSRLGEYSSCAPFLPVNALGHSEPPTDWVTCRHLRAGMADTWRLYPKCALGDESARAKYLRDQLA